MLGTSSRVGVFRSVVIAAAGRWTRLGAPALIWGALLGAACGHEPTRPGEAGVRTLWFAAQAPGFPYPSPLVSGDTVFFASGGGEVVAREIGSGRSLWTSRIGPSQYSVSPEIQGENFVLRNGILVTAAEYHTSALNTQDGHEIWRYHAPLDTLNQTAPRPGLVLRAHIAADDNTVFIPAWGASVSAVDIRTGSAKWVWRVDPTVSFRSGAEGVQLAGDTA